MNPLLGIGLGSALSTYSAPPSLVWWDLPFKLTVGALGLGYLRYSGGEFTRQNGVAFVVLYFVYLGGRLVLFPG